MEHQPEWVAERILILRNQDTGTTKEIALRVGRPYWTIMDREAACPVEMVGIFENLRDIRGIDPCHALFEGLAFIDSYLRQTPLRQHLFWKNGEPYDLP